MIDTEDSNIDISHINFKNLCRVICLRSSLFRSRWGRTILFSHITTELTPVIFLLNTFCKVPSSSKPSRTWRVLAGGGESSWSKSKEKEMKQSSGVVHVWKSDCWHRFVQKMFRHLDQLSLSSQFWKWLLLLSYEEPILWLWWEVVAVHVRKDDGIQPYIYHMHMHRIANRQVSHFAKITSWNARN